MDNQSWWAEQESLTLWIQTKRWSNLFLWITKSIDVKNVCRNAHPLYVCNFKISVQSVWIWLCTLFVPFYIDTGLNIDSYKKDHYVLILKNPWLIFEYSNEVTLETKLRFYSFLRHLQLLILVNLLLYRK